MYLDHALDAVPPATPVAYMPRRAERIAFDMLVRYSWRGQRGTTLVKDLTRFGARIEGISGLRKEDWLTLLLPDVQPIDAEIAWVAGTSAGLAFDSAVPLEAFDSLVRNFATGGCPPPGGFSAAA
ncbi:hypothetical protein [Novosphingobium sp.]|uniref:hypothetical protein n=1 Tax=Novosphingobium sp. TaxID=1874826 RepID=UPI002614ED7C|nr:hypothetical protein [Novosphingobium sp.]